MNRAFLADPVDAAVVHELLDLARRAPSAGNTGSSHFLALLDQAAVRRYWDTTLSPERRASFPWPGLLLAPVLVVIWTRPEAYVQRYGEKDKASTGLGEGEAAWSTPYWYVDGGMSAMTLLLGAQDVGLGALFFGVFEHEAKVREAFGVPASYRAVGVVALGHRAPEQRASGSSTRPRPSTADLTHLDRW